MTLSDLRVSFTRRHWWGRDNRALCHIITPLREVFQFLLGPQHRHKIVGLNLQVLDLVSGFANGLGF